MNRNQLFSESNLESAKNKVWHKSVLPFIFNKKTNFTQKTLFWIAEHTLAGVTIGMLSISAIGVLAWETTKDFSPYPAITEIAFKNSKPQPNPVSKADPIKSFSKGNFQPIIVETDDTLQPLEKITSGKNDSLGDKK